MDDVLSVHQDLQDSYLKECMLTDPDLLGCITGICAACLEFCNFMEVGITIFMYKIYKYMKNNSKLLYNIYNIYIKYNQNNLTKLHFLF